MQDTTTALIPAKGCTCSTLNFTLKSYAQPSIKDTSKTTALSREDDIVGPRVAIMVTGVYLYPTCVLIEMRCAVVVGQLDSTSYAKLWPCIVSIILDN